VGYYHTPSTSQVPRISIARKSHNSACCACARTQVYDVDLAGLIRGVPEGMRIQGLREKLGKITSDYRFQVRCGLYHTTLN
jgi:hypothetical protein